MGKGATLGELLARAGVPVRDGAVADPAREVAGSTSARSGMPPKGATSPETPPASPAAAGGTSRGPDLSGCAKLVLRRERKGRGGKTVTVIDGLPQRDLDELVRAMKKALGCGASVEGEALVLLGDLAERASDWLVARGARRVVVGN